MLSSGASRKDTFCESEGPMPAREWRILRSLSPFTLPFAETFSASLRMSSKETSLRASMRTLMTMRRCVDMFIELRASSIDCCTIWLRVPVSDSFMSCCWNWRSRWLSVSVCMMVMRRWNSSCVGAYFLAARMALPKMRSKSFWSMKSLPMRRWWTARNFSKSASLISKLRLSRFMQMYLKSSIEHVL